ncbi:phosphotransferase [Lujinxingia vulgaris]|uniref:Phosphotransferase n=1 Tax=Lujinxingia vulgaris TaxID=2600176 RepID=A0A5C6XHM0_9DELT|nr:phosphotransferase [Lujinxingia vulgaris]TXD39364.1 phosphotransferase [Lujinxingia vulgaris]
MVEHQPLDREALQRRLRRWEPVEVIGRLPGGTNPGVEVRLGDGRRAVYREYAGGKRAWATECGVCGELAAEVGAPELLGVGEERDGTGQARAWSLVAFVQGSDDARPQALDVAEAIVRVASARSYPCPGLLGEGLALTKRWATHREEYEGFMGWALGQEVVVGRLGEERLKKVRAWIAEAEASLAGVGARAYLMHGDLKDAHMLGRRVGGAWGWWLVDWEMGRAGHPLIELGRWSASRALSRWRAETAEVLEHLDALWLHGGVEDAREVVALYRLQTLVGTLKAGGRRDDAVGWALAAMDELVA